jgi:hypothetical protein
VLTFPPSAITVCTSSGQVTWTCSIRNSLPSGFAAYARRAIPCLARNKGVPDALDGLPECPWQMIPPPNILGFLTGL